MTEVAEVLPADRAAALARLDRDALPDPFGGHATAGEVAHGSRLFELRERGQVVGVYAADLMRYRAGCELQITAAAGRAVGDLCQVIDAHAEGLAIYAGADVLTTCTARPGLVRKLTRRGWVLSGWILRRAV